MRTIVRLLVGFLGVGFIVLAAVSYFQRQDDTLAVVEVADGFTKALNEKDFDKALSYFSKEFAAQTTGQELQAYLEKSAIGEFSNVAAWSRSTQGEHRILTGFAASGDSYVVPVAIGLMQEEDAWKVYSMQASTRVPKIPSKEELLQLVSQSIFVFAESVNEKSMAKFYKHISTLWRNKTTVEDFDRDFGAFYEAGVNLTVLQNHMPEFDSEPTADQNGHLILAGKYPTTPAVHFEQKYRFEDAEWKLVGFTITLE